MDGSNRLPILASEAKEAHKDVGTFVGMAAAQALKAGAALVEAKTLCGHGKWTAWLKATGISERSAQRYMLMHRAGLKPAIVADLGFAAAERYASLGLKLVPDREAASRVFEDAAGDGITTSLAYWWRAGDEHVRYWCIQNWFDDEVLHLNHTIPIWLLGAMEDGQANRLDLYRVQSVTREDAQTFIDQFEAAA